MPKRILKGTVVSDKRDKTVTVSVERRVRHPLYSKIITKSKKYHAHDERNECKEGDVVSIVETKPISKTKTWEVIYTTEASAETKPKATKAKAEAKKPVANKNKK